jgi:uncharacterized membrane protein
VLHYLIKVTDNTLSAALVFSLLCAFAALVSRKGERRFVSVGAALGFAAALVYAILKRNTGFAVREYYDLGVMLPSLVLSLVMLAALWRPWDEGRPAGAAMRAVIGLLLATQAAYALPNLLLYPFEFAVGMESVFNTEFFHRVAGYGAGLLLMFLLASGVDKISAKLPRGLLQALLFAALFVFFAKLSLEVAQILVARNIAPRRPWLTSLVILALNHANWFAFGMMALAAFSAGFLALRFVRAPIVGENPAVRRKRRAERRSLIARAACVLSCVAFSALTITELRAHASEEAEISPALEIAGVDGEIRIPVDTINDGNLHRFQYRAPGGTAVRFIVIKKSETAYGVGLDACDICGPTGYYQRKGQVVCKLCDVVINIATIGFPGGCNPVPLRFSISEGRMRIATADLDAEEDRFRGAPQAANAPEFTPAPGVADSSLSRLLSEWRAPGAEHAGCGHGAAAPGDGHG